MVLELIYGRRNISGGENWTFVGVALLSVIMINTFTCLSAYGQARLRQLLREPFAHKQTSQNAKTPSDLVQRFMQCSGTTRTYYLHIPAAIDSTNPLPLLLVFHGGGGTAVGMAGITRMTPLSDAKRFILVYPQGLGKQWNDGRKGIKTRTTADDVAFISQLIDTLEKEYPIDRKRVYACGISNGGFFSQRLICQLPEKIAAAASVVASMPADGACVPNQPVPIMFVLGTADPLVPFQGGLIKIPFGGGTRGAVKSASDTASYWLQFDCCPRLPQTERTMDGHDGTIVNYKSFGPGTANSELLFCTVEGGGHCWPGGKQYLPKSIVGKTSSVDGNQLILSFFERHRLPNN